MRRQSLLDDFLSRDSSYPLGSEVEKVKKCSLLTVRVEGVNHWEMNLCT